MTHFSARKSTSRKIVTWVTLALFSLQPILTAAQVAADANAPAANRPTIDSAANGTPVVNIAAPSAAGISHNFYQQFNIDPQGLILNNSLKISQTQLAGYIQGNPNLKNGSARIILNEVTGNNISNLRGYLEVAGQKADVIIANRNGIIGNGFGFINTSRGVLTTGTPVFGGGGSLDAFRVTGGQITAEGNGIDGKDADRVDLISRAVQVNAGIWAKELNAVTGTNQVDYTTLNTQQIDGDAAKPQVAIDVAALGGMYANKIRLVGTEHGVGVNSQGTLAAAGGDLVLTNDGKITLAGTTSASGNVTVTGTEEIASQGTLYAQGNMNMSAAGTISNTGVIAAAQNTVVNAQALSSSGIIAAGLNSDGTIQATGNLTMAANGDITTNGQNIAGNNLIITGASINASGAATQAGGALTINAAGAFKNDKDANDVAGKIKAATLTISAGDISNKGGILQTSSDSSSIVARNTFDNTNGIIAANGASLTIQANAVTNNQGQIQHAGTGKLTIETNGDITNRSGTIVSNGQTNLDGQNIDNQSGLIGGNGAVDITAQSLHSSGQIVAGQDLTIQVNEALTNSADGQIKANRDVKITAGGEMTNQGNMTAARNATINAGTITNAAGAVLATGNDLTIAAAGNINNNGQLAGNAVALQAQQVNNTGTIAAGTLTVQSGSLTSTGASAAINSTGDINLLLQSDLTNQGIIYAQGNTTITAANTLTNTGVIASTKNTNISSQTIASIGALGAGIKSDGSMGDSGNLIITATGLVASQGQTLAGGNLAITGTAVDLTGSKTYAASTANITTTGGDVTNTGGDIEVGGALTVTAAGTVKNDKNTTGVVGKITAQKVLITANNLSNKEGSSIKQIGSENTTLNITGSIDNTGGSIATNGAALTIQAGAVTNSQGQIQQAGTGGLTITATGDITNEKGTIVSNGQTNLNGQNLDNTQGTVAAQKQLAITADSVVNTQGTFVTSDSITLLASGKVNNQQGVIQANKGLHVSSQALNNSGGKVINLDASNVKINVNENIQNQAGMIGGNGDVDIMAQSLINQDGQIIAKNNLTLTSEQSTDNTNGTISAGQDTSLNQGKATLTNLGGKVSAGRTLDIQTAAVNNTGGTFAANQDITFAAQSLNGNGQMVAGQDLTLEVKENLTNSAGGQIKANRDAKITAGGALINQGNIIAVRNANINAGNIINDTGAVLVTGNDLTVITTGNADNNGQLTGNTVLLNAQKINNTGKIIAGTLTMQTNSLHNLGNSATINSTNNMKLQVKGTLTNQGIIYSRGDAILTEVDTLTNTGVLASAKNTNIAAQTISSTGAIGAGINSDGSMGDSGNLTLTAVNAITSQGQTLASGNLTITGTAVDLTGGKTYAGAAASITATSGDINNTGGNIEVNGTLTVTAAGTTKNDKDASGKAGQIMAKALTVTANSISNKGGIIKQASTETATLQATGSIDNTNGTIASNSDKLILQSNVLTNSGGQIQHAGTGSLEINATNGLTNTGGSIVSNGQTTIQTSSVDNTKGSIISQQQLKLKAPSITNRQGVLAGGIVNITSQGAFDNQQGLIQAGSGLVLNAQSLDNQSGSILNLDNTDGMITVDQVVENANGLIGGNGNINLNAARLNNQGGQVLAQGNLTINTSQGMDNTSGKLLSQQHMSLNQANALLNNTNGNISASKTLTVQASEINNAGGALTANEDVAITTQTLNGTNFKITSGQDVNITLSGDYIQVANNQIQANRDIRLTTSGTITNEGNITAVRNASMNATGINNKAGAALAAGNVLEVSATGDVNNEGRLDANKVVVKGQNVNNTGTIIAENLAIQANNIKNTGDSAMLATTSNMDLSATSSVENKDGATMYSLGNITISGSPDRDASGQPVASAGSVLNQSATIEADGNISIYAGNITNKKRVLTVGQTIVSNVVNSTLIPSIWYTTWESSGGGDGDTYQTQRTATNVIDTSTAIYIGNVLLLPNGGWFFTNGKIYSGPFYSKVYMLGETITETKYIADSPSGKCIAGGNIVLRADTINNNDSMITANGILDARGTLNNISQERTRTKTRHLVETLDIGAFIDSIPTQLITDIYHYHSDEIDMTTIFSAYRLYDETTYEQLPSTTSFFGGGQAVNIQAPSVNNITKSPTNVTGGNFSTLQSTQQTNVSKVQTVLGNTTLQGTSTLGQSSGTAVNPSSTPVSNQAALFGAGQQGTLANIQADPNGNTILQSGKALGQSGTATGTANNTPAAIEGTGKSSTVSSVETGNQSMNLTLPSNGLYTIHQEPSSRYLVETDTRFTSYTNFISSDYMLQRLGLDPAKTMKQVGDGFYQQKLIGDQITQLTGNQLLSGYTSKQDEYKSLLENGVTYAKQFDLQVGVALTAEQMKQLTSDMVWMVEQEVEGQKVLVPVVYLAYAQSSNVQPTGSVITAKNVNITAEQDIVNQNATITGSQVNLIAGRDIKNETVTYVTNTDNNLFGNDTRTIAGQTATISGQNSVSLIAGRDISITGAQVSSGQDIVINAGRDLDIGATDTIHNTTAGSYLLNENTNITSSITAGNTISLIAKQDVDLSGVKVSAGQDVAINAGHDLTISAVANTYNTTDRAYLLNETNNITSSITAGNNISLAAKQDADLSGVQVTAGNGLALTAGNITLLAVKDRNMEDQTTGSYSNWTRTRHEDETAIGTNLQAGGNVIVAAVNQGSNSNDGNITIAGSKVTSLSGAVTLAADKSVTLQNTTEKHESLLQTHRESSGWFSSTTTDTLDYSLVNQVVGSTVSGNTVTIATGNDIKVIASNVVGTNDVSLKAGNSINITSADETGASEHYVHKETSGIFSGGGLGFTIGSKSEKTTLNEQTLGQVGSTIGSIAGNVSMTAGDKFNSAGTTLISGKDMTITAKDVAIDNTINTYDSQYKYEFKQSGLTVSLGGGVVNTALNAYSEIQRAGEVKDNRLQALYAYKAAEDLDSVRKTLQKGLTPGNLTSGIGINVSIGSTSTSISQNTHIETVNTSNVSAGGNVNVKATDGNINLTGTKINATDITLDAKKDININAAQNKQDTKTNTSSSSWSLGGTIGFGGSGGFGYNGGFGSSSGKENENSITHSGSVVDASGTVNIKSGNDTNITGSKVIGDKVKADIGGNLNIASTQDSDNYTANNQSVGIGISTGQELNNKKEKVSIGGATGSFNNSKTDSTYSSVTDQAGIYAGQKGFDINVGKNTDLKAGVISSEAPAVKNALSTGTLTIANLENRAQYNASSTGFGIGMKDGKLGVPTPNIGMPVSGNADSTTQSAISPGTIIVNGVIVNPENVSRDTDSSLNALGKIFDKKTVQEKQELAGLFGEVGFGLIHKLSKDNGWKEGSPEKVALHALMGGIMAQLSGGSFTTGAFSAGLNEAIQNELAKIGDKSLHQLASALVGAIAAKLVSGDAQTGAAVAASATKNNYYAFAYFSSDVKAKIREVIGDDEEKAQAIYEAIEGTLNPNDDNPPTASNEVGAAEKIKDILSDNGITGDQANQIIMYYLQKADDTLRQLDSYYAQGRQASIELALNAGLIYCGIEELKALYQMGKISYGIYLIQNGNSRLNNILNKSNIASKVETSASEVNAWWKARGYEDPYLAGTKVYQITLAEDTKFVRVYPESGSAAGGWVMKAEDIQGLTAQQIQQKFALPSLPANVCDVELKAGDTIRMGIAGPLFGQRGGGIQYDLMQQYIGTFTNPRPLP